MKEKIKEALKQEYKNLGLTDEAFEGAASLGATFITEESAIPGFVKNAEKMLKQIQSAGDKARGEASDAKKKSAELQTLLDAANAKLNGKEGGEGSEEEGKKGVSAEDIAAAVASALKPLSDELTALKSASTAKEAALVAKETFFGNDYAKKYADEAKDAWERATELNVATGSKLTAEQLSEKAMSYFNAYVSRKGVDTSKPFVADTVSDTEGTIDWSAERKRKQEQGKIATEQ